MPVETKSTIRTAAFLAVALATLSASGAEAQLCVDPANSPPCFMTIQAAVTAALPNQVINVAAATYTEQVTINKNLTIIGAGAATTIIQPVWPMVPDANGRRSVVSVVGGAVVNLSAVTVQGRLDQAVFCDNIHYGIFVWQGSNLTLDASIVQNIVTNQGMTFCNNGDAIRVGRQALAVPADRPGTATVTNSLVQNYQKGGIVVDGAGSTSTLTGNVVLGSGLIADRAMNGIQIGRGATAQVTGNIVTEVRCGHPACGPLPTQDQSMGIYLYRAGASTVSGNVVVNSDVGIYSNAPGAIATLTNNSMFGNRFFGIIAEEGTTNATHNLVQGGTNIGIAAYSYQDIDANLVPYHDIAGNTAGTFQRNTVLGAAVAGFDIDEHVGAGFLSLPTGSHNRLVGNPVGILNQTLNNLVFNDNWFGCNAGPGNAGCDTIVGPVTAATWLILRASANPPIVAPVAGATSIVTGDVTFNNNLVDTTPTSFIRDQTPMTFAVLGPLNNPIAPSPAFTVNGLANSTYTVVNFPGTDTVCVTLDNETVCIVITVSSDLELIKRDFADPVAAGRQIGYTITVRSNIPMVQVKMTDTLPGLGRFQAVRKPVGWTCTSPYPGNVGGSVVCTFPGTLPTGTYLFGIDILAPPLCNQNKILFNTATVTSLTPELVMTNNTDTEDTTVNGAPCFF